MAIHYTPKNSCVMKINIPLQMTPSQAKNNVFRSKVLLQRKIMCIFTQLLFDFIVYIAIFVMLFIF